MMKAAMQKWLQRSGIDVNPELGQQTCAKLGIKGDAIDACQMFTHEFDKGEITEAQFIAGLSEISKKSVKEVQEVLKSMAIKPQSKEYQYRVYLGDAMNNKIMELTTRDEHPELPTDALFYITFQSIAAPAHNRYLPVNPDDPAWPPILAELEKQTRRIPDVKTDVSPGSDNPRNSGNGTNTGGDSPQPKTGGIPLP